MSTIDRQVQVQIQEDPALGQEIVSRHILITGATGFVGTWLLKYLEAAYRTFKGDGSVHLLARSFSSAHKDLAKQCKHVKLIPRDLRSLDQYQIPQVDLVLHTATPSTQPGGANPDRELSDIILEGQDALVRSVCKSRPRFLFTSSGAVYGPNQGRSHSFAEDDFVGHDPLGTSVYAESKRLAERRLAIAHDYAEIELVVARLFAFSGPFLPLSAHFAIGNFIRDVAENSEIVVASDGRSWRSYLYGADMARWIFTVALAGEPRTAYNIGSSRALTIADLANIVNSVLGGRGVKIVGQPREDVLVDNYTPNVKRAKDTLQLREIVSLEDAILTTYEWGKECGLL